MHDECVDIETSFPAKVLLSVSLKNSPAKLQTLRKKGFVHDNSGSV
jgi:hypothetical protein